MASFSVVIPVYNAEKYLSEAIQSITNQTFADWELVLVDDCSTDQSIEIIQQFMKRDSRIRLYKLPKNSGSAYRPIQKGITKANYEWIVVMGDDDYLEEDYLKKLNERLEMTHADIVFPRMYSITNEKKVLCSIPKADFDMNQVLSGEDACMLTIPHWIIGANGGGVRKSIFLKAWEQDNDQYSGMNADELLTRKICLCAPKVAFTDSKYFYRYHEESITKKFTEKRFHILQTDLLLKKLIEKHFGINTVESAKVNAKISYGVVLCASLFYRNLNRILPANRQSIRDEIKNSWEQIQWKQAKPYIPYSRYLLFHYNFEIMMFFIRLHTYVKRHK